MNIRILLPALIVVLMAATTLFAEEFNPVLGKVADFTFREADMDRLLASQPAETQKRFQDDPQLRVNLVKELLIKKATVARARKEGFIKLFNKVFFNKSLHREPYTMVYTTNPAFPTCSITKY